MKETHSYASVLRRWELAGFIAMLVIVLVIPLSLLKRAYLNTGSSDLLSTSLATFTGREKCRDCHRKEHEKWTDSHHDKAMDIANDETVLGDFNNTVFEHKGVLSRFFKKGSKYFVNTQGPDGRMADFEITHTFGFTPLQQYLIPFPGGRLQCLTIAWDAVKKKWYHLYPDEPNDPDDWLHWTKHANNWNGMCAECHSTNLRKMYNIEDDSYETIWSEIDVSCEACHGPGSKHVEWAEVPEMGRSTSIENYGLVVKSGNISSRQQVEACARCHARRASLGDFDHFNKDAMDFMIPQLLSAGLYFPDGQILDEVYVYGSFTQSKMYQRGIRCSDCHDVHSLDFHKEGNNLCLQCHSADRYDTYDHHFHKREGEPGDPITGKDGEVLYKVGEGAECVKCHMPGRIYMGIDYRNDHSIRIPRPDLSGTINTPNACKECHWDKTNQWSVDHFKKWYGIKQIFHYGTVFADGRNALPENQSELVRLANDQLSPGIVRATALSLLRAYPNEETLRAFELALSDPEPMVRHTALHDLAQIIPQDLTQLIVPLLYDPIKAVRLQAAMTLTGLPRDQLNSRQNKIFNKALEEYKTAMEHVGDFSTGQFNLGNMYMNLGDSALAEKHFKGAVRIDNLFYPAKVNLAMLYNQQGSNEKAEKLFREVIQEYPDLYDIAYSLGLLLVEKQDYEDAVKYLKKASDGMPGRDRINYNLGLLLQQLGRDAEAEAELKLAYEKDGDNFDYLYALADFYLKRRKYQESKYYAEQMVIKYPDKKIGHDILSIID